jgi:hypothetical protein
MNEPKHRAELAKLVEQRRRELESRPDISQTMRRLSESSHRNPVGKPARSRKTTRALILTGAGVVALVICILGTAAVIWANTLVQTGFSDPANTVQQFYSALHETNYSQAYSYFSKNAKAHLSQDTFTNLYSGYDRVDGIVQDFPIQSTTQKGDTAEVVALVTRRGDASTGQLQTLTLVSSSSGWLIDGIVIGATIPLPTATASSS